MKKQIISGFFIVSSLLLGVFPYSVAAATLPPNNPFYFVQDGVRSLRRALTFSPVSRALLELRLVEGRRTDLEEILHADTDERVIFAGLAAYDDEVNVLAGHAKGSGDNRVLTGVAELFVSHTRFWNKALGDAGIADRAGVRSAVTASRDNLSRLVTETFGQNGHGAFRSRAEAVVLADRELYAELHALDALAGLSYAVSSADMTREIGLFKEDMAIALVGKLKKGLITADQIASQAGDPLVRFYSISAMRDRAGDIETKNALAMAGQSALASAAEVRLMTAHEGRAAMAYAAGVKSLLGDKSSQQVDYFIQQADRFLSDGAYGLAFQHAVLASGAAVDSLLLTTLTDADLKDELMLVKRSYDALRIKPAFIDKRIVAIADAIGVASGSATYAAIREVKLILALLGS
jgi:hypothetical protein